VKRLRIRSVTRVEAHADAEETFTFEDGVNVIVGAPNTGKTRLLRTIDFLLGKEESPEEVLSPSVADRFKSAKLVVQVEDSTLTLERRWKEPGVLSKVFVERQPMDLSSFGNYMLDLLAIPKINYPLGDPYGPRGWVFLGWRDLLRHAYRRQDLWADLVEKQLEGTLHACVLHFLGLAERVFSEEGGQRVELQKRAADLRARRDQFNSTLQEISRELVDDPSLSAGLTPASIDRVISQHEAEVHELERQRSIVLGRLAQNREVLAAAAAPDAVTLLGEELVSLRAELESIRSELSVAEERQEHLESHKHILVNELERLQRAKDADSILAPLKITHCPACDRTIDAASAPPGHCVLCTRPLEAKHGDDPTSRLTFEMEQGRAEIAELNDLLQEHATERTLQLAKRQRAVERLAEVEASLRPTREAAAAILPPELQIYDHRRGQLQEQIAQLRRIGTALAQREVLAAEIQRLDTEIAQLATAAREAVASVDFESAGDRLADGMTDFLNAMNATCAGTWQQAPISWDIDRRPPVRVRVGRTSWKAALGGTMVLYFLLAYHYSLMSLNDAGTTHYPGLGILDFPPTFHGVDVTSEETFLLRPFVELLARKEFKDTQLIAAGSLFDGLEGANRIALRQVWVDGTSSGNLGALDHRR
jgi:hypothetical protein